MWLRHGWTVFIGCAMLTAGDLPQDIPNGNGLRQAWLQAMYAVEQHGSTGFMAENAAQCLKLSFGPSETRLMHGDAALTLRLVGFGRADQMQQPEPARVSSARNRIEYRRGALTEWYINDARGLEQGFTLSARPSSGNGPLVIALETAGALHPALHTKARSSTEIDLLDSASHAALRYGDLKAWDARGRVLAATLAVEGREVRLIVEDSRAVYPVTIDPTVTQIMLVPSDGASSGHFAQSMSISGNTAVIGANTEGGNTGAAYVFVLSNGAWSQQAKLTPPDGAGGDFFGGGVSVDGETALIGAPGNNSKQGAAYVFVRSGITWNQQAKLTASDGASGDQFGLSVAVSGSAVVAGASGSGSGQGAAYIFTAAGSTWSQQAKLTAVDAASGDQLGASVSLSGTTAVAGAPGKSGGQGAAYVFFSSAASWAQQAKLTAADGAALDGLGSSVAASGDTVLAGAPGKVQGPRTPTSTPVGAAYTFVRSGTTWSQQAELSSSDGGGAFGYSVALSGSTAVVGEVFNLQLIGSAFVFVRSGSTWTQQAKLDASDRGVNDQLGTSVAVSGSLALAGAPLKTSQQGAAYVFAQVGTNWTQTAKLTASDATSADNFGNALSVNGNTALIASPTKNSLQGAVYVFVRSDSDGTWSQQAKLTLPGAASGTAFGEAVSLSGNTALIAASGAAYVFVRSGTTWTQQAKLVGSDTVPNDIFGFAAALDGDTAVVTAFQAVSGRGASYVFVRSGDNWTQQAKLVASDAAANDLVGRSVALNGDTVVAGASFQNSFQGSAYVFVRSGTTWTQQAKLTASDGASGDNFGFSVSVSGDSAIAGAYNKAGHQGAAYVFTRTGANWTQQAKLLAADATAGIVFGISVSIDADLAVVGANRAAGNFGAVYVFSRAGTNWTQYMKLTAANGASGDNFGGRVSINGGTVLTGASTRAGGEGAAYLFPLPTISVGGLVNAASFAHTVAPGSIASVFGTNYANSNGSASSTPLPDNLNGVSIAVNNIPAPLIFVGQFQVNFQVPFETAPGMANVVVTVNGVPSPPATVNVTSIAPGIFIAGPNQAVVLNLDNSLADSTHPAKVGSVVVMYVTGLGPLDHPLKTGFPASSSPVSNAKTIPTVTIGGANAVVQFAGMSPGFVGLGQINIVIPKLANGSYPVVIEQGGQTSNNPVMSVKQ